MRTLLKERDSRHPPIRPVGAKLELTGRCNLMCSFCYTDSPYRTRVGEDDLDDDQWLALVDQCIEVGIMEAVVTGGEPLLRKDLTLKVIERFDAHHVSVVLDTNGWFVDSEVAHRLAQFRSVRVNLSIDGRDRAVHDSARGVRGSFDRAVAGLEALLAAKVRVQVVSVITPANIDDLASFLHDLDRFGASAVRLAVTVPTGAATRGAQIADWFVDGHRVRHIVAAFRSEGTAMRIRVTGDGLRWRPPRNPALPGSKPPVEVPRSFLVQSDGFVRTDSITTTSYGHAPTEGIDAVWQRLRTAWHPDIETGRTVIPYRDPPVPVPGHPVPIPAPTAERTPGATPVSISRLPTGVQRGATKAEIASTMLELALERHYAYGPIRLGGDAGARVVRVAGASALHRLNTTAAFILERVPEHPLRDIENELVTRWPDQSRERLRSELLRTVNDLERKGVLVRRTDADVGAEALSR